MVFGLGNSGGAWEIRQREGAVMASSSLQSLVVRHLQIQKHTARAVNFNFYSFCSKICFGSFFFLGRSASVFSSSWQIGFGFLLFSFGGADDWEAAGGCGLMVEIGEL